MSQLQELPSGFMRTICGGTRNAINLNRPWQVKMDTNPSTCPFCTKRQREVMLSPKAPIDWLMTDALFTPHQNHHLIIPRTCWPMEKLQCLGGRQEIQKAFVLADLASRHQKEEMELFIHVGYAAGQSLGHPHWHSKNVDVNELFDCPSLVLDQRRWVHQNAELSLYTGGIRAGQCIVTSRTRQAVKLESVIEQLAEMVDYIVRRGNEKFISKQGMAPDFMVVVRISNGDFLYATYIPILNMWGGPEYGSAMLEGGPITLPWSHETTADYLR